MSRAGLLSELGVYAPIDEREGYMRRLLIAFVRDHDDCFSRDLQIGHITASAWVVDAAREAALLTHHRKLGRWLQLGGHADGDDDVRRVAVREAREESGLRSLRWASPAIYDIDVHTIPARPGEPQHEHYDVRFAFTADRDEPIVVSAESHAVAWIALDELAEKGADDSVLRLARKTGLLPANRSAVR